MTINKEKITVDNFKSLSIGDNIQIADLEFEVKDKDYDYTVGHYYILERTSGSGVKSTLLFDLVELSFCAAYRIKRTLPERINIDLTGKNPLKDKHKKDECSKCYFVGMDLIHVPSCSRYKKIENQPWAISSLRPD